MNKIPEIIENYKDFEIPPGMRKVLDELLASVPEEFLRGLQSIVLTNHAALTRAEKKKKTWSRNKRIFLADARGYYCSATASRQAFIVLHVDKLMKDWKAFQKWPVGRYMVIGELLYHEIGHHIHREHRPVYKGGEDVAEYWKRKLMTGFVKKRYWYLWPALYVAAKGVHLGKRAHRLLRRKT